MLSLARAPVLLHGAVQSSGLQAVVFVAILVTFILSFSVYTLDLAQSRGK